MFNDRIQKTEIMQDDWILGDVEAPVTMLEYGDFECPYCAMARPVLEALVVDYPDMIRLVYRHFPITTTHPHAALAAEAAEAAGTQGRFWEMHDMLFTNQDRLEFEDLRAYAREIGLQRTRFDQEMREHVYQSEVGRDFRRGIQEMASTVPHRSFSMACAMTARAIIDQSLPPSSPRSQCKARPEHQRQIFLQAYRLMNGLLKSTRFQALSLIRLLRLALSMRGT